MPKLRLAVTSQVRVLQRVPRIEVTIGLDILAGIGAFCVACWVICVVLVGGTVIHERRRWPRRYISSPYVAPEPAGAAFPDTVEDVSEPTEGVEPPSFSRPRWASSKATPESIRRALSVWPDGGHG